MYSKRELAKEELREQGIYSWGKSLRALVRPVIVLSSISFYIAAKIKGIELSQMDYYLIGGVFDFYFGLRSVEKAVGKS